MYNSPALRSSLAHPASALPNGANCENSPQARSSVIAPNPVNGGLASQTFIAIPLDSVVKPEFVDDVRKATTQQQFFQSCAHR